MRTLLIDDMRDIRATVICRNGQTGIEALKHLGPFDTLYLDNDMGFESIQGYEVLNWLERPENLRYRPLEICPVTSNPAARQVMDVICARLYYDYYGGVWTNAIPESAL